MFTAIVLSAGLSSRMVENKMLQKFDDGVTMIAKVVDEIQSSGFDDLIVVTGRDAMEVEGILESSKLRFARNSNFKKGMTSSIQKGVSALRAESQGFAICLGDMPLIKKMEYDSLLRAFKERLEREPKTILVPVFEGRRGNPVFFASGYAKSILGNLETEGCKSIVKANEEFVLEVEMETGHVLVDIDTPADLVRVKS